MLPPPAWLAREHGNLRAALRWLAESGDVARALRLGAALGCIWGKSSYLTEGRERLVELIALPGAESYPAEHAWAKLALVWYFIRQGDSDRAEALCEESLSTFRQLGDGFGEAWALVWLANVVFLRADFPTELAHLAASEMACESIADAHGVATHETERLASLRFLQRLTRGYLAFYQGDHTLCRELLEPLLAEQRRRGLPGSNYILYFLGMISAAEGRLISAGEYLREALANGRENGDLANLAAIVEALVGLAAALRRFERAARLAGVASALRDSVGAPAPGVEQRRVREQQLDPARQALGGEGFAAAYAAGRALTLAQGLAEALAEDDASDG
jgi:tetratricopeptide (TPR) repeat protein